MRDRVRARIAVQSTSSIAIAASARCRNIAVAAPPSVGTSLPSISRPVREHELRIARAHVRADRGAEPRRPPRAGARAARTVGPRSLAATRLRASALANTALATYVTSAIKRSATTKCTVTHQGSSSVATTTAPTPACARTSGKARTAGQRSRGRSRATLIAATPVSAVSTATRNAIVRWENSIREWIVPDGNRWPGSHAGQVEHPSPEPVPRTSPPIANSTIVAIAVTSARDRKREWVKSIATPE